MENKAIEISSEIIPLKQVPVGEIFFYADLDLAGGVNRTTAFRRTKFGVTNLVTKSRFKVSPDGLSKMVILAKACEYKNQNYIVEYDGEPVTRLSFEGQKANVTTGDIMDAIWYTAEEAAECAAAIGTGAEAVRQ